MKNILDRIKFKFNIKNMEKGDKVTFIFDNKTGQGIGFEDYDIFRDEVTVRYSSCGYVSGYGTWSRKKWNSHYKSINRDWIKL